MNFSFNEKNEYHEYNFKMEFNKANEKWTSDKMMIYNGYILQPAIA